MTSVLTFGGYWTNIPFFVLRLFILFLFVPVSVMAESGASGSQSQGSPYRLQTGTSDAYRLSPVYRSPVAVTPTSSALAQLPYSTDIAAAAKASSLDPALVHALVSVESGHRQDAVSPKGAIGLMQLMPGTALRYGVRSPGKSPEENLRAGTMYLRDLLSMFDNRLDLALAAYNAGEGAVQKYGNRIPPYRETRNYVPAVIERYEEWRALTPTNPQPIVYLPGTRLDDKALIDFRSRAK
jgi:soluble lytic murein transglycosylase-like protein